MTRGRPVNIPKRGDVPPKAVAQLLGLSLADFTLRLPDLISRGFPEADATTGNYCVEAVDRWRLNRFPAMFEGTFEGVAVNPASVFEQRRRQHFGTG